MTTTTTTPLTDAELDYVQDACGPVASLAAAEIRALRAQIAQHAQAMGRVTDENQGLRAERDDLLAALKRIVAHAQASPLTAGTEGIGTKLAAAAIARAEGRAE